MIEANQPAKIVILQDYHVLSPNLYPNIGKVPDSKTTISLGPSSSAYGVHRELADTKATLLGLKESTKQSHKRLAIPSPSRSSSPASPRPLSQTFLSYLPDTRDFDTALAAFQWHISYCGLGSALSTQRAAFYSLVQEQTGCTFNMDEFAHEVTQSFSSQQLKSTKKVIGIKWPESALVQRCLEYFERNGLYSIFPIVDVEAVQILLNANVLDQPPNMTRAANRACLVAFAAMITQIHRHERAFAGADPDAYLQAALTLLPEMLLEPPDIRTLESVTILVSSSHVQPPKVDPMSPVSQKLICGHRCSISPPLADPRQPNYFLASQCSSSIISGQTEYKPPMRYTGKISVANISELCSGIVMPSTKNSPSENPSHP